jgi:23S rRNA pseudouridine1911/1915/1917 synthase
MSAPAQTFEVSQTEEGMRLDQFLVGRCPQVSRRQVQQALARKEILVNGRAGRKGLRLRAGQRIAVMVPWDEPQWTPLPAPNLPLDVLYDDDHLLVVNKPAGLPCHPLEAAETHTVASAVVARYPELAEVGPSHREAGLLHRLDITTSGALVFGKHPDTFSELQRQIRDGLGARKVYDALVVGQATQLATVTFPLAHRGARMVAGPLEATGPEWQRAVTTVVGHQPAGQDTLLRVEITSGRRHQIRVHLAAAGHPLVGDVLYGAAPEPELGRPFLHAREIHLLHPATGQRLTVVAPWCADLVRCLERRRPRRGSDEAESQLQPRGDDDDAT